VIEYLPQVFGQKISLLQEIALMILTYLPFNMRAAHLGYSSEGSVLSMAWISSLVSDCLCYDKILLKITLMD